MSSEVTEISLQGYEAQLDQVKAALRLDSENDDLIQLRNDLLSLIELTKETLLEQKKRELLAQLGDSDDDENEQQQEQEAEEDVDLEQLIGMKCVVPFNGSKCSAAVFDLDHESTPETPRVRVIFTHPTVMKMKPCDFYLRGKCRFDPEKCRYSHGESVRISDLAEKDSPEAEQLSLSAGMRILAKCQESGLWGHAKIIDLEEDFAHVRFSQNHREIIKVKLEDVHRLDQDEDQSDVDDQDDDDDANVAMEVESEFVPLELEIRSGSKLGEWERHTRGIGSRLMAKMGYVHGTGLGQKGQGKVEPVAAFVYPQGKSLDWCMERKSDSVEKKAKNQQKNVEKAEMNKKQEQNLSVFDFINSKLGSNPRPSTSKSTNHPPKSSSRSSSLKSGSKVELFKIGQEIEKCRRDGKAEAKFPPPKPGQRRENRREY